MHTLNILFFSPLCCNVSKRLTTTVSLWLTQERKKNDLETGSTEEGHDDKLKSEMKAKKTNLKNISALLKVSFSHRRKWINGLTGKGAVKKVLEEYPGFNKYNQVGTNFFSLYILAYNVDKTLGVHAMIGQTPMI